MARWCCGSAETCSRNSTDAQDAFQATFLVLVRRRGSIGALDSVGGWLNGVACRVAARRGSQASRRRAVEERAGLRIVDAVDSPDGDEPAAWNSALSFRRKSGGCRRNTATSWCSVTGRA